jgi:hypothetical protein
MNSSEIEPATFQLLAQCLNQLCYRVPSVFLGETEMSMKEKCSPAYKMESSPLQLWRSHGRNPTISINIHLKFSLLLGWCLNHVSDPSIIEQHVGHIVGIINSYVRGHLHEISCTYFRFIYYDEPHPLEREGDSQKLAISWSWLWENKNKELVTNLDLTNLKDDENNQTKTILFVWS